MNFKNIVTSFVAGASLLAMVGSASALNGDINIYGSYAQSRYWRYAAPNFLSSQGCTNIQGAVTSDGKNVIYKADCPIPWGHGTLYFRISISSNVYSTYFDTYYYNVDTDYDGILAVQGNTTNPNRTTECSNPYQRMMMDPALVTFWGSAAFPWTVPNTAVGCFPVTGGASDVQFTSFQQESHGALQGPNGYPGIWTDKSFKGAGAVTDTGLTDCRALAVPFAFYVNNDVTKGTAQVTDLTMAQVRLIFSGQVGDWSDLGFDAQPMTACLRHAGSGIHASLDLAVMRPAGLILIEDVEGAGSYNFYFNDSLSDEMYCVNYVPGAVGYAYADQNLASYPNVHQVTYNGVAATKTNIVNGYYDFFSIENLYAPFYDGNISALCSFMQNPANNANSYYANLCQLKYTKVSDDGYLTINNEYGVCQ